MKLLIRIYIFIFIGLIVLRLLYTGSFIAVPKELVNELLNVAFIIFATVIAIGFYIQNKNIQNINRKTEEVGRSFDYFVGEVKKFANDYNNNKQNTMKSLSELDSKIEGLNKTL